MNLVVIINGVDNDHRTEIEKLTFRALALRLTKNSL